MMSFGALNYFGSVIQKLENIIVLYQPRDLHLWPKPVLQSVTLYTLCTLSIANSTLLNWSIVLIYNMIIKYIPRRRMSNVIVYILLIIGA